MNDDPLPPELARIEQELATRPMASPGAALRRRILATTSQPLPFRAAPMSMMEFAMATAAGVILCANLSLSLSNQTDYGLNGQPDSKRLDTTAQEIARILPDTLPREGRLWALPLQWRPFLSPTGEPPLLGTHGRRFHGSQFLDSESTRRIANHSFNSLEGTSMGYKLLWLESVGRRGHLAA